MNTWKLLGLAGLAGVATATGVVVARRRRTWTEVEPDELRERLHERLRNSSSAPVSTSASASTSPASARTGG